MENKEGQIIQNTIDQYAETISCQRHVKLMNACRYENGKPCTCREEAEKIRES
jgi:hypothetical protein